MLELDPQIAKAVSSKPAEPVRAETLSMMRAASNKPLAPPSPRTERRDHIIDREHAVAIRVYRPAGAEGVLPCVYSMRGGGYVFDSYANDDARLEGVAGATAAPACRWSTAWRPRRRSQDPLMIASRAEVGVRPPRRARCRPQAHWCQRDERGSGPSGRAGIAGPRPERGAAEVPAARCPDDRRPPGDPVEPAR